MDKKTSINEGDESNDNVIKTSKYTRSYKGWMNSDYIWKRALGAMFYDLVGGILIVGIFIFLCIVLVIIVVLLRLVL